MDIVQIAKSDSIYMLIVVGVSAHLENLKLLLVLLVYVKTVNCLAKAVINFQIIVHLAL